MVAMPATPVRAFSVMAKPVGSACNLDCSYCYYLATPRPGPPRMPDEVLERFIATYIASSPGPEVSFVWHGGEPTLAGLDFYRRVVELQARYLPAGWAVWNNLQTNGVILDDEWCAFLKANRFDVGLSIDGTRWCHDLYRVDARGHPSYQAAAAAVRRLQAHGIQPDLLCTVTPTTAAEPRAVYRALRDFGTGWIQFIPIHRRGADGRPTADSVGPEDYGDFLCAVFDDWVLHDLGHLEVQLFAETARMLAGGGPGLCWLAPVCGQAVVVEADGAVYSCDHYVNESHRLGEVTGADLGDLVNSATQQRFGELKRTQLPGKCLACPWLDLCNGGCPKDRLVSGPDAGVNHLCPGLTKFFAHATPRLGQVVSRTKRGEKPDAIMAALRAEAQTTWQGVGRNDPCPCGSGLKAKRCCWAKRE